jgi:copper transport protein
VSTDRTALRAAVLVVGVLVAGWIGLVLGAGPAAAHASLVSSSPAQGEVVATAPERATFTFDDPVQLPAGGVQVFDAHGKALESAARTRGGLLIVELPDEMSDGTYVVTWRVVSDDGHPLAGTLTFSVGHPSPLATSTAGAPAQAPTSVTVIVAVLQALRYLGTFAALGLAFFAAVLLPAAGGQASDVRQRLRRPLTAGAVLAAVGAVLLLPVTALDQQGRGWDALLLRATLLDPLGRVDGAAAGLLVLGLAALVMATRRGLWSLALVGGGLAVISFALVGHTRSAQPTALVVAADLAHVAAGSVWFGGLIGLVVALRRLSGHPALAAGLLSRFSTAAAWFLGTVVVAGTVLSWRILQSWSAFVDTSFGRTLLVKLGIFLLVVVTAAINRYKLLPALVEARGGTAERHAAQQVRRVIRVEAVLLVGVLAATGVLVDRSPEPTATSASSRGS